MEREIKFRVWLYDKKEMHSVVSIWGLPETDHITIPDGDSVLTIFNNFELMQFTGLKDKNGIEIYEGDILQVKNSEQEDDDNFYLSKAVVTYTSGGFVANSRLNEWYTRNDNCLWKYQFVVANSTKKSYHQQFEAEIIGNIFRNPELLTQLEKK